MQNLEKVDFSSNFALAFGKIFLCGVANAPSVFFQPKQNTSLELTIIVFKYFRVNI